MRHWTLESCPLVERLPLSKVANFFSCKLQPDHLGLSSFLFYRSYPQTVYRVIFEGCIFHEFRERKISAKIAPTKSLHQVRGCGFLQIAAILKFTKYTPLKTNGIRVSIRFRYTQHISLIQLIILHQYLIATIRFSTKIDHIRTYCKMIPMEQ